jgi:hypothetical protein
MPFAISDAFVKPMTNHVPSQGAAELDRDAKLEQTTWACGSGDLFSDTVRKCYQELGRVAEGTWVGEESRTEVGMISILIFVTEN